MSAILDIEREKNKTIERLAAENKRLRTWLAILMNEVDSDKDEYTPENVVELLEQRE